MSDHTDDEAPDSAGRAHDDAGLTDGDGPRVELQKTKERLEAEADRAVSGFDENVVDLLAWLLDTETRARIYVYLRQQPHSTSDEIAEGTGLYPSTVREALADLHEEDTVRREKRDSDSAGNNPYQYEAIAPSNLVRGVVGQVQQELNTVFTLEGALGEDEDDGPVRITVDGDADDGTETIDTDSAETGGSGEGGDAVDIEIDDAEADTGGDAEDDA